jgi:hypothetical protein
MNIASLARSLYVATAAFALMALSDTAAAQPPPPVLRYDTPTFAGFTVNPALGGDVNAWDVALRYAGEFGGFRVAAGIGYANNSGDTNYQGTGFSASGSSGGFCFDAYATTPLMIHVPSGLFVSGGVMGAVCNGPDFSKINPGNNLPHRTDVSWYGLVGGRLSLTKNFSAPGSTPPGPFPIRSTTFYGELGGALGHVEISVPGFQGANESTSGSFWGLGISVGLPWGAGTVQNIDAAAMEIYLGYRQIDLGSVDARFGGTVRTDTNIDVVNGGARIRF